MRSYLRRSLTLRRTALCTLAAAAAVQLLPPEALACDSVAACVLGQNSGSGPGLRGLAVASYGVYGSTSFKSTSAATGKAGVYGVDDTATSKFNFGVFGSSPSGVGVAGISKANYAVTGTPTGSRGSAGTPRPDETAASNGKTGVAGLDGSTNQNTFNSGVYGYSGYANGVHAKSPFGYGLYAESANNTGVRAFGPTALLASTPGDESAGAGYVAIDADSFAVEGTGLAVSGGAFGIVASIDDTASSVPATAISAETGPSGEEGQNTAFAGNAVDGAAGDFEASGLGFGLIAGSTSGTGVLASADSGVPLSIFGTGKTLVTAANASKDVMSVDSSGNLILAGSLMQHGTPLFALQRADGREAVAYGARATDATLEDSGQAMLSNGVARVALDPAFAASLDSQRPYLVFLTPEGDNGGLYISQKSAGGFTIREHAGGRSTLVVDYRILAKPLGERYARLPVVARLFAHDFGLGLRRAQLLKREAAAIAIRRRVWERRARVRSAAARLHA